MIALALILTNACSDDLPLEPKNSNSQPTKTKENPPPKSINNNTQRKAVREIDISKTNLLGHIIINDSKMRVIDQPLKPGSRLYDYKLQTEATLGDSVVVVLKEHRQLSQSITAEAQSTLLATNTYKLTPLSKENLYKFYMKLKNNSVFKTVELEVRYDKKSREQNSAEIM